MPRLDVIFRKTKVKPRIRGVGSSVTITLTFVSSTADSGGGVSAVSAATDAEQSFSFTEVSPRTGLPRDLEISESSVLKLVVTFPADYDGDAYTYTDTGGTPHAGTFPSGNGTVNY